MTHSIKKIFLTMFTLLAFISMVHVEQSVCETVCMGPSDYWVGPEGVLLKFSYNRWSNGQLVLDGQIFVTHEGQTKIEGHVLQKQRVEFELRSREGKNRNTELEVFQTVNDTVSFTFGIRVGDGPIEFEELPNMDLHAPLTPGAKWEFHNKSYGFEPGCEDKVEWEIESKVVVSDSTVEVPAGVFSNCLLVKEIWNSVGPVRLTRGAYSGKLVRLKSEIERWWSPGIGAVKERANYFTVSSMNSDQVLNEYIYESELLSIGNQ